MHSSLFSSVFSILSNISLKTDSVCAKLLSNFFNGDSTMARKPKNEVGKTFADNKREKLEEVLKNISKQFGAGAVVNLGENKSLKVESVPTGFYSLDKVFGCGGIPKGRIIEIYGPESSGKTTTALHLLKAAQDAGLLCMYIDVENALDSEYAQSIGVEIDKLYLSQPNYGEEALRILDSSLEAFDFIVVDSVAALVPKAEIEGEIGDSHVGLQARMMSQSLRRLAPMIKKSNAIVIFINQTRMKIGVMYGSPEATPGGVALKFYASVRLRVSKETPIAGADKDKPIGENVKIHCKKNKVAPPFRSAILRNYYGSGLSKEFDLLSLALECGLIEKSGAWFSYEGETVGQGEKGTLDWLKKNEDKQQEIINKLKEIEHPIEEIEEIDGEAEEEEEDDDLESDEKE